MGNRRKTRVTAAEHRRSPEEEQSREGKLVTKIPWSITWLSGKQFNNKIKITNLNKKL